MHLARPILVIAPLAGVLAFAPPAHDGLHVWSGQRAYAARDGANSSLGLYQRGIGSVSVRTDNVGDNREADNDGDNSDGDNGENSDSATNDDNDNTAADNSDNAEADNGNIDVGTAPSRPPRPTVPPQPTCSTPGQDTVFTWGGGRVAVRVFGSTPQPLRVQAYLVENPYDAPQPPGTPVYTLMYEIRASSCDTATVGELPADMNLEIRYTDRETEGLDKRRLQIGRFDLSTATWGPVEQQANDPTANVIVATIPTNGFYLVWEAR
jgi:hypothetical protein